MRHPGPRLTNPPGRLLVGTSGFAYPDWTPRFYPAGTRAPDRLAAYAAQLPAVELNATFRRRPTPSAIQGWVRATPPEFRFAVKAQRGSAVRGLWGAPEESVRWLTEPLPEFGERLGAVLFRVPAEIRRDGPWVGGDPAVADARLAALLAAWPREIPLVVELQDRSWHVDETFAALRAAGATLCTTELPPEGDEGAGGDESATAATSPDREPPMIRRTGSFLYLRLRLHDYDAAGLDAWAARIEPFLAAGDDVYVFFRHDPVGRAGELALELKARFPSR
ncbi:MAG TPA: DUF72 domain-containing protein [Patescibacteria group bacterium]|nr:DUF72 domain-containing protein [Patescibacteria group bacterium]